MPPRTAEPVGSARRRELLERSYAYALEHGLGDLSLRPLAAAVGSSPRVLLYLFGSKDGLVRALLARSREEELELLGDGDALAAVWAWLADPAHRPLLSLWVEAYGRSLIDPAGPWGDFARTTVADWLAVLADAMPGASPAERTLALAVLRGALLDLLATGDLERVSAAVARFVE